MDKSDALRIGRIYAEIVKKKFDYNQMILFGSYAKGTPNDDSDIDIAVVFEDYDETTDMQLELIRLRRKIDSRIEPHPFKEIDFNISNPIAN
jgi:uncharacterized protein